MHSRIIAEPWKIKTIEPIHLLSRQEREQALQAAGLNPFLLRSDAVFIDLLTDSGTGAMSALQWAAMLSGDEAYAGSRSFTRLREVVEEIFAYPYTIPVHQGRGAEQILFPCLVQRARQKGADAPLFLSNYHFDTTKAHVELAGAQARNCICAEAAETHRYADWKGNFDLKELERELSENSVNTAAIIITITCNSAGGQPVSMANIKAASRLAAEFSVPVIIDAARFAENAYFIKEREKDYQNRTIEQIIKEIFSYADIFTMSAKKDGLVNIGGLCCFRKDKELFEEVQIYCVAREGFVTYGGLAGRDLEALSVGLKEALKLDYLEARIAQVRLLGELLHQAGVPVQYPVGGHAVFVDAGIMLPHIKAENFPAQVLCNALYLESGVRAVEIGSLLAGRNPHTGEQEAALSEFMRLAIPRRTYTDNHIHYTAEAIIRIADRAETLRPLEFAYEPPLLRHFTAKFREVQ